MSTCQAQHLQVECEGDRLDAYLASQLPELSRARVQQLIKAEEVCVNGRREKASYRVQFGDTIIISLPDPVTPAGTAPENLPLEIVYQDADLLVINKQAGLVVHPGAGNWTGTLVNALLYHVHDLSGIGGELRPGLVHRLDKDTSGLLLIAKHDVAHRALAAMIEKRIVVREYLALAWGNFAQETITVDAPIGRDPVERQRMAVLNGVEERHTRRQAVTHFTVLERLPRAMVLTAKLETGRTHQIRVHLFHLGYPVVHDPVYGHGIARRYLAQLSPQAHTALDALPGQALHAFRLTFPHPRTGENLSFEMPPPPEFLHVWEALKG